MSDLLQYPLKRVLFQGAEVSLEERTSGVIRLVLKRSEKRNALHRAMVQEALEGLAFAASNKDPNRCRLLLLEGEGPSFCAGADLAAMCELAKAGKKENTVDAEILAEFFKKIASFPAPVVTYIQGAAIGGGCGLAAASDFVVAEESALIGTTEVLLGIIPAVISPYLVRRLGTGHASAIMLTGKRFTAAEAHEMGLVNRVVPDGEAGRQKWEKQIGELLLASPEAMRRTKKLLLTLSPLPSLKLQTITALALSEARASSDGEAGLKSFVDKVDPPWIKEGRISTRAHAEKISNSKPG